MEFPVLVRAGNRKLKLLLLRPALYRRYCMRSIARRLPTERGVEKFGLRRIFSGPARGISTRVAECICDCPGTEGGATAGFRMTEESVTLIASNEKDLPVNAQNEQALLEKLKALPPERVAEVEDFVDFLRTRDDAQQFTRAAAKAAEPAFRKVWDNTDDAAYDRL